MLYRCTKRKSLLADDIFNAMIEMKIEIKFAVMRSDILP